MQMRDVGASTVETNEFLSKATPMAERMGAGEIVAPTQSKLATVAAQETVGQAQRVEQVQQTQRLAQSQIPQTVDKALENVASRVNQSSTAILKNGYYEVNGFKFTRPYV